VRISWQRGLFRIYSAWSTSLVLTACVLYGCTVASRPREYKAVDFSRSFDARSYARDEDKAHELLDEAEYSLARARASASRRQADRIQEGVDDFSIDEFLDQEYDRRWTNAAALRREVSNIVASIREVSNTVASIAASREEAKAEWEGEQQRRREAWRTRRWFPETGTCLVLQLALCPWVLHFPIKWLIGALFLLGRWVYRGFKG